MKFLKVLMLLVIASIALLSLTGCAWMQPSNCPFCDKDDPRPHLFHTKMHFIVTADGLATKDVSAEIEAYQKRKATEDGHPELWKNY